MRWDEEYLKQRRLFKARFKPDRVPKAAWELATELRRTREARGITLDEVSKNTFINKRFLEAIEAGNLDQLPGGVYTRSYFKLFARYIQFDESVVIRAFTTSRNESRKPLADLILEAAHRTDGGAFDSPRNNSKLPKFGEYLLYFFLSKSERVIVIGDMEEEFETIDLRFGKLAARIWFYKQFLSSIFPFAIKASLRLLLEFLDLRF